MKRILQLAVAAVCLNGVATAQQVRPATSAKIYHEIAQLNNLVSVLYMAAHPDDENTRLLAYLVNDRNIRTGYLALTRGDGGQNLLGSEQGAALGLIRTHELIEARKLDGAEQYFTRAVDFGFSKNYEETFKHWDKEELTEDATLIMRRFRPDVVICRFPPDTNAGHGHHAASAIIAKMAFEAAGDANRFPEQLKTYGAWQPKRIVFNSFKFGSRNTTSEDQYKLTVGQYVPGLGMGVGELAGYSRSVHKSQGAGTPSVAGVQTEYFKPVAGAAFSTSLFEGIDSTWGRVGKPELAKEVDAILAAFDFNRPDKSVPALAALRAQIETVKDAFWRKQKLDELDAVLLHCSGFMAELYTKDAEAVRSASMPFTLHVIARCSTPIVVERVEWPGVATTPNLRMEGDTLQTIEQTLTVPASAQVTQPYWLQQPMKKAAYFVPADKTIDGVPEAPPQLTALLTLRIGEARVQVPVTLSYKKLDPVKGDVVEALRIVPDATVAFGDQVLIAQKDGTVHTDVRVHAYKALSGATLDIKTSTGERVFSATGMNLPAGGDTLIRLDLAGKKNGQADYTLHAEMAVPDMASLHLIQYSHLPVLQYLTPAEAMVVMPRWQCTAKRIGYIEGAGDNIPAVLRQAGLEVDMLKEGDITDAKKLQAYDAIVTGIRAVNAEKRMAWWMPLLLEYAANGGTLVVQYNTLQDMATTQLGPYPFKLSSKRVTEEDATVKMLQPSHRLMTYPNKLNELDFGGWVQERGLYFPVDWDSHYTPLFSMHDAGEPALDGSTLYTPYGKGHYLYTALSFSRQLPAGNAGAIRLMMNMLSVGK